MEKKKRNIYEIAREAGVSPSTVSRVINQPEKVKEEKRELIQGIIRKYDFKPNVLAKGLSSARSGVLGLLSGMVDSPFYGKLVSECLIAAEEQGYVLVMASEYYEKQESQLLERIGEQQVESVILLGGNMDYQAIDERMLSIVNYMAESVPLVVMGKSQGVPCYEVRIDESGAMEQAMEYLVRLGHRKIAFWGGEESVYSVQEKRLAYLRLLRKYGIEKRESWLQYGGYEIEDGYRMMAALSRDELPTAVIGFNDLIACGVMRAALDAGIKVPRELSLIAFDNTYLSAAIHPALCSVACDYRQLARRLIGTAVEAARGGKPQRLQLMETKLVERESCCRAELG